MTIISDAEKILVILESRNFCRHFYRNDSKIGNHEMLSEYRVVEISRFQMYQNILNIFLHPKWFFIFWKIMKYGPLKSLMNKISVRLRSENWIRQSSKFSEIISHCFGFAAACCVTILRFQMYQNILKIFLHPKWLKQFFFRVRTRKFRVQKILKNSSSFRWSKRNFFRWKMQ